MTQLFNIQGLMSATAQAQKLAQIMRDGREGSQVQHAAETTKNAEEARGQVAPAQPNEKVRNIQDDEDRRGQERKPSSHDEEADSDSNEDEGGEPNHHIDIIA